MRWPWGKRGFVTTLAGDGSDYRFSSATAADSITGVAYASDGTLHLAGWATQASNDVYVARIVPGSQGQDAWYSYDELGNLTNKAGVSLSYGVNGNGTGAGPHQARSVSGQPYSYDAAGNLLSGGGRTYSWDDAGRLTSVTQNSVTTSYGYDGDGQRVSETVNGVTRLFLEGLWEETLDASGQVEQRYMFGGQLVLTVVTTQSPAQTRLEYAYVDHLGSVSTRAGGNGTAQDYEPWGQQRSESASLLSSRRFTGQRQDSTGLLYYNARYYDPALGRFISADAIVPGSNSLTTWPSDSVASAAWGASGGGPANPQELNRYSYALNNPLKYTDPMGHCGTTSFVGTAASTMTFDCTRRAIQAFQLANDPGDKALMGTVVALSAVGATAGWIGGTALGMAAASTSAMAVVGAVTVNNVTVSAAGLAASSALASGSASTAGQLITNGTVDPTTVAINVAVGAVTGGVASIPGVASTLTRAAALGAASNATAYSLDQVAHGSTPNGVGVLVNAGLGAVGGRLGGSVTPVRHAYFGTGATERFLFRQANFGAGAAGRTFASGLTTSIDWQRVRGPR